MAFCPATGKTYVFGGASDQHPFLDETWEWDGSSWSLVQSDVRPPSRVYGAMAYDPVRKSLILHGGQDANAIYSYTVLDDTWEWNSGTRKWSQLFPTASPGPQGSPGMVTDSGRGKVLLLGLSENNIFMVWEWDGSEATWTNRTPVPGTVTPDLNADLNGLTFDDGRQKMFVFQGLSTWQGTTSNSVFWEWDPVSAGWAFRDSGDFIDFSSDYFPIFAYDSLRRRQVVAPKTDATVPTTTFKTCELDTKGPTWYMRALSTGPNLLSMSGMVFDSQRGVIVLFGSSPNSGANGSETWEYKVTNLGNGEGCTAATASNCASGFCVDGVCCAIAACSGACQSCAVAGHEGTCAQVTAGTEISGSCPNGQACTASGGCNAKNGTACSSASACASGFCVDGVCCDSACDGTCVSCSQANRAGKCSPHTAGSDPQNQCGLGSGTCRSTCNGAGACDYPKYGTPCGTCLMCDGTGLCQQDTTIPATLAGPAVRAAAARVAVARAGLAAPVALARVVRAALADGEAWAAPTPSAARVAELWEAQAAPAPRAAWAASLAASPAA